MKAVDSAAIRDRLIDRHRDSEHAVDRETLMSIIDVDGQRPVRREVLRLDFDQARTLTRWIEELHTYPEEVVGRPKNFYNDDDRFNQLLMLLQDATSPGWSDPRDLDGIIWP